MAKAFKVLNNVLDKKVETDAILCQYDKKLYLSEDVIVF